MFYNKLIINEKEIIKEYTFRALVVATFIILV